MEKIQVFNLLKQFSDRVSKGDIQFLGKGSKDQQKVLGLMKPLFDEFNNAQEQQEKDREKGNEVRDLSQILDWHAVHACGRELWEKLASCALYNLDTGVKGNSKLFDYLTAATEFEDLLYGLDRYYRDHTIHSLWVYFIGDYILSVLAPDIYDNLEWFIYNDIEREKELYEKEEEHELIKTAKERENSLRGMVNEKRDAIWCTIALCHDLGYSLAKLDNLNDKVKNVLEFFTLPHISHIGYNLDLEHHFNIRQFLELMSVDVHIVAATLEEDPVIKCFRDDSTYWQLCQALEKKQHGILSSYLIYKIVDLFADIAVRDPAEEWGLSLKEAVANIIRGDILFAITQHEFEYSHLNQMSSLADILILADDMEEFSRYGRQLLARKYHDTMATSQIEFIPSKPKPGQSITINITFNVAEHGSLSGFFLRKAQHLCKVYSLNLADTDDNCRIANIKMTAAKDDKELCFILSSNPADTKGLLPSTKINNETHNLGEYNLVCQDDKIYVDTDDKEIPLKMWLGNVTDTWWITDKSYG